MANNARTSGVLYVPLSGYQGMADSLQAAQADVHAQGGGWIVVDADYAVNDTYTVPSDVHLRFEGGSLTVASGKTLTLDGRVDAPIVPIFGGTGTVILNGEPMAPLEWFGGVGDDSTDATAALTSGDACYNGSTNGGILVAARQYAVATGLTAHSKTALMLPLGGRINVASGQTLTWPGNVVGWEPSTTTFAGAGTVTVSGTYTEAGAPTGAAGGDLTGNYPSPTIAAGKVTAAKIAANTITATQLAAGAATGAALGSDVVTTSKGMVQLAKVVVPVGGQASIPFSAISQNYENLVLIVQAASDAAVTNTTLGMQINGDTGNTYDYEQTSQSGATVGGSESLASTPGHVGQITGASGIAGGSGTVTVTIPSYTRTTFWKTWASESFIRYGTSADNANTQEIDGNWRNTAAITALTLLPGAGSFVAGSVATLYGVA